VPPRVHVPEGSRWDRAVAGAGWVLDAGHAAGAEVAVLVVDLPGARADADGVELDDRPTDAWWDLALHREPTPDERHVVDPGPPLRTVFARVPGAGVLRAAVVEDHLHLSRLRVSPDARRAGVATRLVAAVAAWGGERGARWAVLQVARHNRAGRAFADALGAVEHHRYRYLVPPP
jgi:ribosomal protein S18 acetylase RimI-like enzyme